MTGHFHLAYVLNATKDTKQIPSLINEQCPSIRPYWLVSVNDMQEGMDLAEHFEIARAEVQNFFVIDSGGYSVATGAASIRNVIPAKIANAFVLNQPYIGVGPDFPVLREDDCRLATRARTIEYYSKLPADSCVTTFDVVHGSTTDSDDNYSLSARKVRFEEIKKISKGRSCGIAVPPVRNDTPEAQVYFALQPWAYNIKRCHLLGRGGVEDIPLFIHIARRAYDTLTSDCSTYTLQATKHAIAMIPNRNGLPVERSISRNNIGKLTKADLSCPCPICAFYQKELGTTLYEMAQANRAGQRGVFTQIGPWLSAHNVYVMETFICRIRELANDERAFESELKKMSLNNVIKAIKFVNHLIDDGRKRYAHNVKRLNDRSATMLKSEL